MNALVSSGGAGTHFLNKMACSLLHPRGWKTHATRGHSVQAQRIIYLYSNPYDQIISFDRRKFLNEKYHCLNMGGDVKGLMKGVPWDLDKYLRGGVDHFKIEGHFESWYAVPAAHKKIFIKYECLPDVIDELTSLCKLPDWFPKKVKENFKPRRSDWTDQDEGMQVLLFNMFGKFYDRLSAYPPLMQC